ncbi:MAG: hypothetical protein A3K19_28405 [Lentisphaerae bacterium RIFOXYB12_FULL_65_16]|nr:MAG: hypothetical protein A3K18_19655 [Lentisphaerae bacterium RIFOXYA12_64_32]OGV85510.1 MAG: hypothetical protein A3K19_28405 [Lentisphaerae bacterium RIFOXYB12_FULL_65_16]
MSLSELKADWEELGRLDPLWAILSGPDKQFGKWELDRFFLTGEQEIGTVLDTSCHLGIPANRKAALDFGCGVGRLARALARRFEHVQAVDISENMILQAKELNRGLANITFTVNAAADLQLFPDRSFDFVYTDLVLQHLPERAMVFKYVGEFVRVLERGGGLVFQMPCYIQRRYRFQVRRRVYLLLRSLGLSAVRVYQTFGLNPIQMRFIPEREMIDFLGISGAKVLHVETRDQGDGAVRDAFYYATR